MEAYLRQMGIVSLPTSIRELEIEYYRRLYKVLPREEALSMPLKQVRSKTSIQKR